MTGKSTHCAAAIIVAAAFFLIYHRVSKTPIRQRNSKSTDKMALDSRMYRGLSYDARAFESSASTPSLRSLEPVSAAPAYNPMPENDSSSVKVVVRVRAFLKRGR